MEMVDVTSKEKTARSAIAKGFVQTTAEVVEQIETGNMAKGDVLAAARIAAIMAVKRTPDIIPLCHPIAIGGVVVEFTTFDDRVELEVAVKTADRTGVEMEALAAICAAGLTVIDMIKGTDPEATIENVRVVEKKGGKTGDWKRVRQ